MVDDKIKQNFNRSEFNKLWHRRAKAQREIFKNEFPNKEVPKYSEFLKKDSKVINNIVSYNVSYQVNYKGDYEHFILPVQTFKVYGLKNQDEEVKNRTINMVQTSKGVNSKQMLSPKTISKAVSPQLLKTIEVKPRGIEKVEQKDLFSYNNMLDLKNDVENLENLTYNKFIVKELDTTIKFKNKKGRSGEMKLDISNFL